MWNLEIDDDDDESEDSVVSARSSVLAALVEVSFRILIKHIFAFGVCVCVLCFFSRCFCVFCQPLPRYPYYSIDSIIVLFLRFFVYRAFFIIVIQHFVAVKKERRTGGGSDHGMAEEGFVCPTPSCKHGLVGADHLSPSPPLA